MEILLRFMGRHDRLSLIEKVEKMNSDRYLIDHHKMMLHPKRVVSWIDSYKEWGKAKSIYPIYVEVSPVGHCNHRCLFCAKDFEGYKTRELDVLILEKRIREMALLGIKSVMFSGEGEPLLYSGLAQILDVCREVGIDTAITTNLTPFGEKNSESIIRNCTWIKASINAGDAKTYAHLHQTSERDFARVIENLKKAVEIREKINSKCTIGAQMILLDENVHTAVSLAKTVKGAGADYLVIKPYSQHKESLTKKYSDISYKNLGALSEDLKNVETERFKVVYRQNAISKWDVGRPNYNKCYSVPFFWAYIRSDGDLIGCSCHMTDERFNFGNLNHHSFKDLWESKKREDNYRFVCEKLDISACRTNCRMDEINRYLYDLMHPGPHDNFI